MYSKITGAIGTPRGPKHGGANEAAMEIIASATKMLTMLKRISVTAWDGKNIIGFGHPVYTIGDPRNDSIKSVSRALSEDARYEFI